MATAGKKPRAPRRHKPTAEKPVAEKQTAGSGHNGPDEKTEKALLKELVAGKKRLNDLKKQVASANGEYRDILKKGGDLGMNRAAMVRYVQEMTRDPDEVEAEDAALMRYRKRMNSPIGTQFGMFEEGEKRPSHFEMFMSKGFNLGRQGIGKIDDHLAEIEDENHREGFRYGWAGGQAALMGESWPQPTKAQQKALRENPIH